MGSPTESQTVIVNGESMRLPRRYSIDNLMGKMDVSARYAVEINGNIVPRNVHASHLIADAGTASDASVAMEISCDAVLMNTAIAEAKNLVLMSSAMRKAIEAGREAFPVGRMPKRPYASASSPIDGTFFS